MCPPLLSQACSCPQTWGCRQLQQPRQVEGRVLLWFCTVHSPAFSGGSSGCPLPLSGASGILSEEDVWVRGREWGLVKEAGAVQGSVRGAGKEDPARPSWTLSEPVQCWEHPRVPAGVRAHMSMFSVDPSHLAKLPSSRVSHGITMPQTTLSLKSWLFLSLPVPLVLSPPHAWIHASVASTAPWLLSFLSAVCQLLATLSLSKWHPLGFTLGVAALPACGPAGLCPLLAAARPVAYPVHHLCPGSGPLDHGLIHGEGWPVLCHTDCPAHKGPVPESLASARWIPVAPTPKWWQSAVPPDNTRVLLGA